MKEIFHARTALAHLDPATGRKRHPWRDYLPEFVVLMACIVTVTSLWVVVIRHAAGELTRLEAQAMDNGADLAIALSEEVGHTFNEARQASAFIAYNYLHRPPPLDLSYWSKIHLPTVFPAVSVLSPDGTVIDSSLLKDRFDYASQPFFNQQRQASDETVIVGGPALDWDSGRWRIPITRHMALADGRFAGVVVVWLDPEVFGNAYREAALRAHDTMTVINTDGKVLMRFGDAPGVSGGDVSYLDEVRSTRSPSAEFVKQAGSGADARARIVSYRALTGYPLYAVVSLDYDEAFETFHQRKTGYYETTAAFSAVIVLLTAALFLMLGRQRRTAQELQETLVHEALHDALTGLANRALFHDHCDRAINRAQRHGQCVAVFYLDLDDFKSINDRHGHTVGDLVLQEIASRLLSCVRAASEDLVARMGGDEFCIMLSNVTPRQSEMIAQKILWSVATPIEWSESSLELAASMGGSFFSGGTADVEPPIDVTTLVDVADRGMYRAKRSGKNQFRWGEAAKAD